jgi:hypothetical protein
MECSAPSTGATNTAMMQSGVYKKRRIIDNLPYSVPTIVDDCLIEF